MDSAQRRDTLKLSALGRTKNLVSSNTEKEPIQIANSIPGHDPEKQHLQLNGTTFIFEVDSGAKDDFCSTKVKTKLGKLTLQPPQICHVSATGNQLLVLGTLKAKDSLGSSTRVGKIKVNVCSCPHLNLLSPMATYL